MVNPQDRPSCHACSAIIAKMGVEAVGESWHPECFQCSTCKCPLASQNYYEVDGAVFCEKDYTEMHGLICRSCGKGITEAHCQAGPFAFHSQCATCTVCSKAVAAGQSAFVLGSQSLVFHEACLCCTNCSNEVAPGAKCTVSGVDPKVLCASCKLDPAGGTPAAAASTAATSSSSSSLASFDYCAKKCIEFLHKPECLSQEGLFRVPGRSDTIKDLNERFDAGEVVQLEGNASPEDICGLLKLRLRAKKLIEGQPAKELVMAAVTNSPARASEALNGIEPSASAFLYDLTILFKAVVLQPDNLMNVNNLSTSVSPTVFPSISLRDAGTLLGFLIGRAESIWGDAVEVPPSTLRQF